jgi:DNA repair protein RadD
MPYNLYDYQQKAIDSIFSYFRLKKGKNPLVVAPGGSGKTVIFAEFCRIVRKKWPKQKILILGDDKEILLQNYKTISKQVNEKIGLYSSGLKSKTIKDITVAGIQTIFKKTKLFSNFNIIIVDEAHKVSLDKKSRYLVFLIALKLPTIGFTATPFRPGTGYLHLGKNIFFDGIAYIIKIETLQNHKPPRLCRMINKQTDITLDASAIKKQTGDFIIKELSLAFDKNGITNEIINDLFKYKKERKKWLVYAIDIAHCEHICQKLNEVGIKSRTVHSKTGLDRKPIIEDFRKTDNYKVLVSVAMITTGVDIPEIDLIAILRPTASPVLHSQIILRGTRIAPGKNDCLVLDYAGNLKRNGPINKPTIKLSGKGDGEAMMKVCENCNEIVHIATRTCPDCGSIFEFKHNLSLQSSNSEIISSENWHEVTNIEYTRHIAKGSGTPMLLIRYVCGLRVFREYLPLEHGGFPAYKAQFWWKNRTTYPVPKTVHEALETAKYLRTPTKILVNENGQYPEIKNYEYKTK